MGNVQDKTIEPLIKDTIVPGTRVYTTSTAFMLAYVAGDTAISVSTMSEAKFARDEDEEGLCAVHVNILVGVWSLLRSWLRQHWGILQEHLPVSLGCFEFVHNVRKRGKALFPTLIEFLVA